MERDWHWFWKPRYCFAMEMLLKLQVVLAIILTTQVTGHSMTKVRVGILWDAKIISDITHLQRSLEMMAELSNNTRLEFAEVTGLNSRHLEQLVCSWVSNGTYTFLSAVGCYQSGVLRTLSVQHGITVIAIDAGCHYEDNKPTYLNFKTQQAGTARVITDIVSFLEWTKMVVLYDDASGQDFDNMMGVIDEANVTIQAYKLQRDINLVTTLDTLIATYPGPRHILLLCDLSCQVEVMQEVNRYDQVNMVQAQFQFEDQWLLVATSLVGESYQLTTLEAAVGRVDNVVVLAPYTLRDKSVESRLEEAFSYANMSPTKLSTILSPCANASRPGYTSRGLKMLMDDSTCSHCGVYDVITLMYGRTDRYSDTVGSWSSQGLSLQYPLYPNLNFGMNGRNLLVTTNLWEPFVMRTTGYSPMPFQGLSIELLLDLAKSTNFTYRLTMPPDKAWGGFENGSWTGMVGQAQRKEVDMVVAPLSIQPIRESVMDFTDPYFSEYLTVLAKLPDTDGSKWSLYISPFKWQVWLAIAGSIPVVGFIVWIITSISPFYSHFQEKPGLSQLDNAVFYMFGALFTQGGIHLPNAQSGRFVVGFWWMYCIVLVATYSGNLIAFLTVTLSQLPFDTLREVVSQDSVKYGIMTQTAAHNEFKQSHDDLIARAWSNIKEFSKDDPDVLSSDPELHIQKVLAGGYAYINDRTGFEVEMSKYCQIQIIRDSFVPIPYGVGFQKGSAYVKTFSKEVRKVIEGGLINKWKVRWWPRQSFCSRGLITEAKSVTLKDVQGAYYVMAILLLVAIVTLTIECCLHAICHKKTEVETTKDHQGSEPNAKEQRELSIWGTTRQEDNNAPHDAAVRDIYSNKEPMVDIYGRSS